MGVKSVSVVVTTYNGEQFVIEQLQSILNQTVPADEVLIFDDCSTDSTFTLCQDYIATNDLGHWHVYRHEKNRGYDKNFFYGFDRAKGDVIFISDQDDVWYENKIEVMLGLFSQNEGMLSLASTFSTHSNGVCLSNHVNHPHRKPNGLKQIELDEFCRFYNYLGMSVAFRSDLLSRMRAEYRNLLTYDILLNSLAVLHRGLFYLDIPLVARRSYPESVSNSAISRLANEQYGGNERLARVSQRVEYLEDLRSIALREYPDGRQADTIQKERRVQEKRVKYLQNGSLLLWLSSLGCVKSDTFRSYLFDGLCVMRSKRAK